MTFSSRRIPQVRMNRNNETVVLIEHFKPAKYMQDLLAQS
jgi:hypothetical protein